jgi:hypothetical protein
VAGDVPLYADALVGYRSWRRVGDALGALSVLELWSPGTNTAICSEPYHFYGGSEYRRHSGLASPAPGCSCGIYAYHSPQQPMGPIVGTVIGWGAVEVHHDGWRAQHAAVSALLAFDQVAMVDDVTYAFGSASEDDVWELAAAYRVPVARTRAELEQIALAHGRPLPREALPPAADAGERHMHVID